MTQQGSSPYATGASPAAVIGGAGTGKTERIAADVCKLLESGVQADDIVVFAATPLACRATSERIAALAGPGAALPLVTTVRAYALGILALDEAVARTGRKARVLLRFEESILMEDLKTSGVHPRKLAEMLKFFYRSWTELELMDDEWFFNTEERGVHDLLELLLTRYEGYLAPEVSRTAFALLREVPEIGALACRPHVLVDDFQMLSKASQCLAVALARESVTIAADEAACIEAIEEFPYAEGIEEFVQANEGCSVTRMGSSRKGRAIVDALQAVRGDLFLTRGLADPSPLEAHASSSDGSFKTSAHLRPQDELKDLGAAIAQMVDAGTPSGDIAVAVASPSWAGNVARELEHAGVPVARPRRLVVGGDPRTLQTCIDARAVTLLALAADPDDPLALRCWCGFGDHLANSGFFASAAKNGIPLTLDGSPAAVGAKGNELLTVEATRIAASLEQARALIASLADLEGAQLVERAYDLVAADQDDADADAKSRALLGQIGPLPDGCSPREVVELVREHSTFPHAEPGNVLVGVAGELAGIERPVAFLAGFVNGLSPARSYFDPTIVERDKRPKLLSKELGKAYCCAAVACDRLRLSYFTEATLRDAELLKLKIERVRLRNGERVCEVHPSEALRSITGVRFDD